VANSNDGSIYVYSGKTGALLYKKTGDPAYGNFQLGTSVAIAGDVDGDGRADFMAGAPYGNPGGLGQVGVVRVYSGATGELIRQFHGDGPGDQLGYSVSSAGDVNGDGYADIIAGGLLASGGTTGRFRVFSGADGTVLYELQGQPTDSGFGTAVASGGDVDRDGHCDFLAGAPAASIGGVTQSGAVYLYLASNELGIIPSESVDPSTLDGFGSRQMPKIAPNATLGFTASGGTAPYTWTFLTNRSGGSLAANGSYTAGSVANVYDSIRITDSLGRTHDTRVLVSSGGAPPALVKRPTGLWSVLVNATQIDLSWTDNSSIETGFVLEYRTPTQTWTTGATLGANVTSYSMTGLDADKVYLFRIKAVGAIGDSSWSPWAISSLGTPTGLAPNVISSTQIDLSWTDQSSAEEGFQIQYQLGTSGSSWISAGSVAPNVTTFSVTGLTATTQYGFRVRAFSQVLNSAWTPTVFATTLP